MTQHMQQYKAGPLTFIVRHELWDGNIQDHADQGVSIVVAAKVEGKHTVLLRFNCLDIEKSCRAAGDQEESARDAGGGHGAHRPSWAAAGADAKSRAAVALRP
jgi:hypothetical protein